MDLIKAQFARLSQQLSGLTASQKMLAGALVAIMAITLGYWARYAGDPEMEPLLNQSFSTGDISSITQHLASREIRYSVVSDKIMVPVDKKVEVLADLGFARLLPRRTDTGIDDIVKQMNPFDSADKNDKMWTQAKQLTLSRIIDNFPGVDHADVMLDPNQQRGFSASREVKASASISITTRDASANSKQVAIAAADLVAGAQADVSYDRINVIVNGARVPLPEKNGENGLPDGDAITDAIRKNESMYARNVTDYLGFIPGLFVAVRVDLNTKRMETQEKRVDPKMAAHLSISEEEHSVETVTPPSAVEPGAIPNTSDITSGPVSVASASGQSNATSNETESKSTYQNEVSVKSTTTVQGPGDAPPSSAAVRVPRSYFVRMSKSLNHGKELEDAALNTMMNEELTKMRGEVEKCLGIKTDDAVSINYYVDGDGAPTGPAVQAASPVGLVLGSHGKELGMGALAVVSLFMMAMMVRKASPAPLVLPGAAVEMPIGQRLNVLSSEMAGEVGDGGGAMEGIEVGSEEAKTQQMINQVSNMVSEDPDSAASLVKRWLSHP